MENKVFHGKKLTEGTSNFWSMDGLPLLIFEDYDTVYDIVWDRTLDELDVDDEKYSTPEDHPDWAKTFESIWDRDFDYCVLDEEEQDNLRRDIDDFNAKAEADEEIDFYEYDYPEVEIKPGYYEAAQLYCNTKYLDEKSVEKVRKFFEEMKEKYGLTQLGVSYHFSNGETGYHKINEKLKH